MAGERAKTEGGGTVGGPETAPTEFKRFSG